MCSPRSNIHLRLVQSECRPGTTAILDRPQQSRGSVILYTAKGMDLATVLFTGLEIYVFNPGSETPETLHRNHSLSPSIGVRLFLNSSNELEVQNQSKETISYVYRSPTVEEMQVTQSRVNERSRNIRLALLAAVAATVGAGGALLIERYRDEVTDAVLEEMAEIQRSMPLYPGY